MSAKPADGVSSSPNPFALTWEQKQLCETLRAFAAREIAPNVLRWDEAANFRTIPSRSWGPWA